MLFEAGFETRNRRRHTHRVSGERGKSGRGVHGNGRFVSPEMRCGISEMRRVASVMRCGISEMRADQSAATPQGVTRRSGVESRFRDCPRYALLPSYRLPSVRVGPLSWLPLPAANDELDSMSGDDDVVLICCHSKVKMRDTVAPGWPPERLWPRNRSPAESTLRPVR